MKNVFWCSFLKHKYKKLASPCCLVQNEPPIYIRHQFFFSKESIKNLEMCNLS